LYGVGQSVQQSAGVQGCKCGLEEEEEKEEDEEKEEEDEDDD
jgi:hypothetical protein